MKKLFTLVLTAVILFMVSACSNSGTPSETTAPDASDPGANTASADPAATPSNAAGEPGTAILVAYFTMPETDGVDAVSGASRVAYEGQILGNTQLIARWISEATGGELFAIETVQTYPGLHDGLLDFANEEQANSVRPELATKIENPDNYDVIFVGFPNWWYDMPMPVYSFFDEYDFAGKTVIPFNTHGGSRFSGAIGTIADMEPDATVEQDGLTVSRSKVAAAQEDVLSWLEGLGY